MTETGVGGGGGVGGDAGAPLLCGRVGRDGGGVACNFVKEAPRSLVSAER